MKPPSTGGTPAACPIFQAARDPRNDPESGASGGVAGLCDNRRPPPHRDPSVNSEELLAFLGRNQMLSMTLAALTVAIIANEISRLFRGFKVLRPAELTAMVNRDNALVVDLRPSTDFTKGHIPGSKNVQMSQFDPENKQLAPAKALPVVLVCKTGQTAGSAAKRLKKAGFENVYVLDGGIGGWQQADLPLVKGRG